jgi:hypothetical protein
MDDAPWRSVTTAPPAESGFDLWRLVPAGALVRFRGGHLTEADAIALVERCYPLAERVSPKGRVISILDWRLMTGYDSRARSRLTEFGVKQRKSIAYLAIVVPAGNRIVQMGISVAQAGLAVAGLRMHLETSLDKAVDAARRAMTAVS